jgi:hypothetical protein
LMLDGEVKIAAMPTSAAPHAPSVCTVPIGFVTSAILWEPGV